MHVKFTPILCFVIICNTLICLTFASTFRCSVFAVGREEIIPSLYVFDLIYAQSKVLHHQSSVFTVEQKNVR